MRTIKISFECHPVNAPSADPASDIIKLHIDIVVSGGTRYDNAIEMKGTQNAINAIHDSIFVLVNGNTGTVTHNTPEGDVAINFDFGGASFDLYPVVQMDATIEDHKCFRSTQPVCRQTNFILTDTGDYLRDEQGNGLIFIEP